MIDKNVNVIKDPKIKRTIEYAEDCIRDKIVELIIEQKYEEP